MKAIDFRCRPPYKDFNNDWYFGDTVLKNIEHQSDQPVPESAWKRDMDLFIKEMDEAGVEKAVLVGRHAFAEFIGSGSDYPGIRNDVVVELLEKYPGRFIGVISVDINDADSALAEIDKHIVNGPCVGVTLEPGYEKPVRDFDDASLYPIYQKCQAVDAFVILTGGLVYTQLEKTNPGCIDKVARDFPNLRILIGHGGWPWITETLWMGLTRPNVYISPDYYMFNAPGAADYFAAVNHHMKDKMIFGTAYPFGSFKECIEMTKQYVQDDETLEKYLYGNAAKFLGLDK